MPDNDSERDLHALRNMIDEANLLLETTDLPEGRSQRAQEILTSALSLANDLIETSPAAALGSKGGKKTAERGSEYFRKIASMRKTRGGGRPRKKPRATTRSSKKREGCSLQAAPLIPMRAW